MAATGDRWSDPRGPAVADRRGYTPRPRHRRTAKLRRRDLTAAARRRRARTSGSRCSCFGISESTARGRWSGSPMRWHGASRPARACAQGDDGPGVAPPRHRLSRRFDRYRRSSFDTPSTPDDNPRRCTTSLITRMAISWDVSPPNARSSPATNHAPACREREHRLPWRPSGLRRFRWETSFLRRAAIVACPSEATADDVSDLLGIDSPRIRVIPIGISSSFGQLTDWRAELRRNIDPSSRHTLVLHVSTGGDYKNVDATLRVMAR